MILVLWIPSQFENMQKFLLLKVKTLFNPMNAGKYFATSFCG